MEVTDGAYSMVVKCDSYLHAIPLEFYHPNCIIALTSKEQREFRTLYSVRFALGADLVQGQ